jgi:Glycosyl hydrolase catalytic core
MVGPWPGNQTANYTERYLPDDMPAYARCLASIVERYDGDGRSDMPGLKRPIHHWEVDNEPDLHHTAPPRGKAGGKAAGKAKAQGSKVGAKAEGASKIGGKAGAKAGKVAGAEAPSDFETPEEYARVLIESARAIRGADARAVVLSGGIYRPHRPEGRDYLRDVLAVPGAREAFDVLSLHCYMEGPGLDPLQRCLATAAELAPDKPVWLTEIGLPSSSRQAHQTEDWQARALVELVARALIAGVDRFYWHSLGQPPNAEQALQASAFATHGLAQSLGEGPGAGHRVKPSGARPGEVKAQSAAGGELLWLGHGWLAWSGKPAAPEGAGPCQDLLQGGEGDGTAPCWYPAR